VIGIVTPCRSWRRHTDTSTRIVIINPPQRQPTVPPPIGDR
jgi:hypothetical protein